MVIYAIYIPIFHEQDTSILSTTEFLSFWTYLGEFKRIFQQHNYHYIIILWQRENGSMRCNDNHNDDDDDYYYVDDTIDIIITTCICPR